MRDHLRNIETLEDLQRNTPIPTPTTHRDLFEARNNLRQHLMNNFEYQLKRSKLTHYHFMNKPSRLMARKVASIRGSTRIPHLRSQSGNHKIINPQDIADEFSDFYTKLYNLHSDPDTVTPCPLETDSFLGSLNLPSLSEAQLVDLNAPITRQELELIIRSLPRGKAPGPDGFSKYYKAFLTSLSPTLCNILNQAMSGDSVPAEMLRATVITLPKPGKTPDTPANF